MTHKKKLIEVALPLDAINEEGSRRKRKAPAGYPTTLHKWWAQRPVAAARAVIFAQLVDDPSAHPDLFPTEKKQEKERQRLFRIIEELVKWDNTTNEEVLEAARAEIWQSWRYTCAENADHPRAKELFDRYTLPVFHDPFAGGGTLPLEAQRLGLEAYASDLNPVAVLINKAMIELPSKFAGRPPVNPEARLNKTLFDRNWKGAEGLAEDARYYGKWMRDDAEKRIGHLYPKIEITPEMAEQRPDLATFVGQRLNVIAWLWVRTVRSPNPAFAQVHVPLASTLMLSTKAGKETHVEPVIESGGYRFVVRAGQPTDRTAAKNGTRAGKAQDFLCLMSGTPIPRGYVRDEGKAGRLGVRLMSVVLEGPSGRVYVAPSAADEALAQSAETMSSVADARKTFLSGATPTRAMITGGVCSAYGLSTWGHLFTARQLVVLTTLTALIADAQDRVRRDAATAGLPDDQRALRDGGAGATAYAEAVRVYLSMAVSRLADYGSSIATWRPKDNAMRSTLAKQAIQMAWDFAEGSPFGESSSGFIECVHVVAKVLDQALPDGHGIAHQMNVSDAVLGRSGMAIVSTDPPYYDNIGYAELSDFFYIWLRRSLKGIFPDLFATVAAPKAEELVATPYRHGGKEKAETFFLDGMTKAMRRIAAQAHPGFPVTVYYAFKQSESETDAGTASTGWETFLDAIIRAGFAVTGTWPLRTEGDNRQIGIGSNALASSIVLVCRARAGDAPTANRREFVTALTAELPQALAHLQRSNMAPVDLAQAAIGPGMAVYTRYAKVLDAEGNPLSVRDALALINQTLDDALAEQEGDFDADSRWALAWFEQSGFSEGEFGVADVLARAKNTAVQGLVEAGIVAAGRGKVRLLKPSELPDDWDPATDKRLTAWEIVHHLIRVLEAGGEGAAATLTAKLGSKAETARELCYRLYTLCERKKRAPEALAYNGLVQSWPEISRLAQEGARAGIEQAGLFGTELD